MWSCVLKKRLVLVVCLLFTVSLPFEALATGDEGNCIREDSPPNICGDCGIPDEESQGCDGVCHSGKEFDECGVCGGSGPGECGCDLSITKDPCGICGGPGVNENGCCGGQVNCGYGCQDAPCPEPPKPPQGKECLWVAAYSGISGLEGDDWQKSHSLHQMSLRQTYTNYQEVPGCIKQFLDKECKLNGDYGAISLYGRCGGFGGRSGSHFYAKDLAQFIQAPADYINYLKQDAGSHGLEVLMDKNCRYREWDSSKDICGFVGAAHSPISLLWDADADINHEVSVVDFSLDIERPEAFSIWKGSVNAPLLVYDPQRTGTVTSAAQLFGTSSFVGLKTVGFSVNPERKTWNHGYEALGMLDLNADDRVSGEELSGLYLWFDANSNAVAEAGELRSLQELDVVSLYYKNPEVSEGSQDLELTLGYERIVNGTVLKGKSVDWYGEVFTSKQEALQALYGMQGAHSLHRNKPEEQSFNNALLGEPNTFSGGKDVTHCDDISGTWVWQLAEEEGETKPGLFVFAQNAKNEVNGYSVVESVLEENVDYHSLISIHPARGIVAVTDEERMFSFSVQDNRAGVTARSRAVLSQDGMSLEGTTVQLFVHEDTKQKRRIEYSWRAYKLQ